MSKTNSLYSTLSATNKPTHERRASIVASHSTPKASKQETPQQQDTKTSEHSEPSSIAQSPEVATPYSQTFNNYQPAALPSQPLASPSVSTSVPVSSTTPIHNNHYPAPLTVEQHGESRPFLLAPVSKYSELLVY